MTSVKVVSPCSLTDAVRESSFVVFPCLCYTRDVADLSELIVARDAQSPFVGARAVCCVQGSPSLLSGSFLLSLMYRHI